MFKNLAITETIWVNALRAFCAGIVIMLVSFFIPNETGAPFYTKLLTPFFMPLLYLLFFIISQILRLFNLGGVGNVLCMIASVPGDPLVYMLHQAKPEWVPVEKYQFFVFAGFISVYKDQIPKRKSERPVGERPESCPFVGEIVADKEATILGFAYPSSSVMFTIDNNWNVYTKGKTFGYIDVEGNIRKGLKGDPKATLAGGEIIGQIRSGSFYVNGKKQGSLT